MRELGAHSDALHAGLAPAILDAQVDELILIGDDMRPLAEQRSAARSSLDLRRRRRRSDRSAARPCSRPGDAVLVKASNSVGLARLVERVAGGAQPCST